MQTLHLMYICVTVMIAGFCVLESDALTGHIKTYYVRVLRRRYTRCKLFGWSRCGVNYYVAESRQRCQDYWRNDGTGNCRIPVCTTPCYNGGTCVAPNTCQCTAAYSGQNCADSVCTTPCYNGGTCVAPNTCQCTAAYSGQNCADLRCSHVYPCYPGACRYPHDCTCTDGFQGTHCQTLKRENNAYILDCQLTLANIRRTDGKQSFHYSGPCSMNNSGPDVLWSNQALFNYANFSKHDVFEQHHYLPPRPSYVTNSGFGIVEHGFRVIHTKINRNDNPPGRFTALDKEYTCPDHASYTNPVRSVSEFTVTEENYKINIEDGDEFSVTYKTKSGGFGEIYNLDYNRPEKTQTYSGQLVDKTIEFHFDFIAPVHCSQTSTRCITTDEAIQLQEDITSAPIAPRWSGWSDDRSGLDYYQLEIFRLQPNINDELVELEPLSPIYSVTINITASPQFPIYKPNTTGMYSILLQAADKANNSRIARRLVLFDDSSDISLTHGAFDENKTISAEDMYVGDGRMHVTTAISETGYMWQTGKQGSKTKISLEWTGHFINKEHSEGKLLNMILPYPTQFQDLSDSGILRSEKVVDPKLDDNTGMRTMDAIPNVNGITNFEYCKIYTADREEPSTGWSTLPLEEKLTFEESIDDGQFIRLWVRATDVMNHTRSDYTEVHIDNTPPVVSALLFEPNKVNDSYLYTSRIKFSAADAGSGVHRIDYKLLVENMTKPLKAGRIAASRNNETDACNKYPECKCVLNQCFLLNQSLALDNCWFLVPKDVLDKNGSVEMTVLNQALLRKTFRIEAGMLRLLEGLEEYSGPTNIHVAKKLPNGVRLAWDLPKTASCYGRMDITIVLLMKDGSIRVQHVYNQATSIDLVGLEADNSYSVRLDLGYEGTIFSALSYDFKTAPPENYLSAGIIAGIVVSVLAVFPILIIVFVVLLRRGHMQQIRRGLNAVSVRYRKSVLKRKKENTYVDPMRESIYQYGELDLNQHSTWTVSRTNVVFDTLLTTGSFALIYKARLANAKQSESNTVVAKTLKNEFTENDELLMKAKINFVISEGIEHENVVKFLGMVTDDIEVGPFMLFTYCEKGPLNTYLEQQRDNLTIELQENLFRFGLGVARGMEYLASKQIVHRRLAARNILLDCALQVKITGFGPLPTELEGDDSSHRRERIPMKWVAPECLKSSVNATEKSDMWSFGVVLWEIFSLGQSPYGKMKGSELPAKLKSGTRLSKPENADEKWYGLMQRTWQYQPNKRPTFKEVSGELDGLFVAAPQDDYYYYRR